jgi:hypothetical protein
MNPQGHAPGIRETAPVLDPSDACACELTGALAAGDFTHPAISTGIFEIDLGAGMDGQIAFHHVR